MKSPVEVLCRGIVQGIGFRPFVYRFAKKMNLTGFVRNQGDAGVLVIVEGTETQLRKFIQSLEDDKPYLTKYEEFKVSWLDYKGEFSDFSIDKSSTQKIGGISYLPPDISICDECLVDMENQNDSRFGYAFTSCAICGPRYTTITNLPYDRPNTTMVDFPFCPDCKKEYENPLDRRYHAQTTCCNLCGPKFTLYTKSGEIVKTSNMFTYIAKLIEDGSIVAIKGIGGTHLACSAVNDTPILKLRTRKGKRKYKPFAIISRNLHDVKKYAEISTLEQNLLTSYRKPIVLLQKKSSFPLSEWVAPNLSSVGVMLPYSGIHSLILDSIKDPAIILTSANPSDIPMFIDNKLILTKARDLADYILLHNRRIHQRADDSVIRLTNNQPVIIRRSRGWVPEPIVLPFDLGSTTAIGVGPLLTSTGAIAVKNRCFPTQYIGNVDTLETIDFLESSIEHMLSLLDIDSVTTVGSDLHPSYLSANLAEMYIKKFNSRSKKVQHHYAHSIALMIDNQIPLEEEIVTIIADGVGYGDDGVIWGGEVLHSSYRDYRRIGHLEEQLMPGGDRATIYPIRMLAGIMAKKYSLEEIEDLLKSKYQAAMPGGLKEIQILLLQLKKNLNTYQTTSTGRILASISAMLNVCHERTYEGEPAIVLEALASKGTKGKVQFTLPSSNNGIINTTELICQAFDEYQKGTKSADIALAVHLELADQFANVAIDYAKAHNIKRIGFTGGVAYNHFITKQIAERVKSTKLDFLTHRSLPCGDGGISTGQAVAASLAND